MKLINLGGHLPTTPSYSKMFHYAKDLNFSGIQFFSFSNRQFGINKQIDEKKINLFLDLKKNNKNLFFVTHAGYLINLASDDNELYEKSRNALLSEIIRCKELQVDSTIVHPGSNKNIESGIKKISDALLWILDKEDTVQICLENSAGQGNTLPATINDIHTLAKTLKQKKINKEVAWCIDTCHAHAAGYNFSDPEIQKKFWDNFDELIGLQNIQFIHCNDSKKICGSRIDRHEFLGKGTIGKIGFEAFFKNSKLKNINKILETPFTTPLDYKKDLDLINSF